MSNLISITRTVSDNAAEPVTLDDMKTYLRVDFTDDDNLITALITAAREKCEKMLSLVLIDTDIKGYYEAHRNRIDQINRFYGGWHQKKMRYELAYGPILEESGVPAITGLPDDAEIIGHGADVWIETFDCKLDISYSSGWTDVPAWALLAIKKQVAWDYESRGDQLFTSRSSGGISTSRLPDIAPETVAILSPHSVNLSNIIL